MIKMISHSSRAIAFLAAILLGAGKTSAGPGHWVTTWATAPYLTEANNLPPEPLAFKTLRQFVRTSIGAKHLRLRLCNAYGTSPVTVQSAHLAVAEGTGSAGTGEINPATDRALTFRGAPGVVIPAGETIWSDSLAYDLPAITTVAISLHFGEMSPTTITGHPGSRTTSFIEDGNVVSAVSLPGAAKTDHWYVIHAIEALADETGRTLAVLGDSITDGRGSTTNGQDRWPDQLATRFAAIPSTATVGIANLGIGANGVLGQGSPGFPSGQARFSRDILNQTGVRYFIVFEGINDIAYSGITTSAAATARANDLIVAYTSLANQARARNIKAYAATITPFGTSGTYTPTLESIRQTVNAWIRDNTVFDGSIDFDAVVRDPSNPSNLLPAYIYQNDGLHINTTGYQAMINSINPNLFTP
jgi:lysophospholipase L1-like esterase